MTLFVSRRIGYADNNLIDDGGGIGWLVVAKSVLGDGGLALFDVSLVGAKKFLESWPGLEGLREGLPSLDVVGKY